MITMISGYPGSGKSTYARNSAGNGGVVVDLDAIVSALTGNAVHDSQADERVVLAVNDCIWELAEACDRRGLDVYVIRTAPGALEFEQYARHCARVYMDIGKELCRERCRQRGDYDAEAFEYACWRADKLMRAKGGQFRRVSAER